MTPREEVLCSTLAILIDEMEYNIVEGTKCAAAVSTILEKGSGIGTTVVNFATERYLMLYTKGRKLNHLFRNSDALRMAIKTAGLGASKATAERVVREAAKFGWNIAAQNLAKLILGRDLNAQEVTWLVDAYIEDRACQSDETERELVLLARKHLSKEKATLVEKRLEEFKKEFQDSD